MDFINNLFNHFHAILVRQFKEFMLKILQDGGSGLYFRTFLFKILLVR